MSEYDVIIVGAGQGGLFCAHRLSDCGLKILVVDEGPDISRRDCPRLSDGVCRNCSPCSIMCGLGGAGVYSDGTLNLRPDVGGDLSDYVEDPKADELIEYVDSVYQQMGANPELYGVDEGKAHGLESRAASSGVRFIRIRQRHMGSENTPEIITNLGGFLKEKGVEFRFKCRVEDVLVEGDAVCGVVLEDGDTLNAKKVVLSPGRVGAEWAEEIARIHQIKTSYGPIDVGVRVEVPSLILEEVVSVNHDPKFHIRTSTYDDFVRTFCTNHEGYVVEETYDGFVGVNGHSLRKEKSGNSNFAFLVRISLTEPVEDTLRYGESIARLATTIGGGRPIIQRLYDLRNGKRSHPNEIKRNPLKPSLTNATPGDLSMALPHRIIVDILEGLEKLSKVVPGVDDDSTLLYAPEIKYYSIRFDVDEDMQTSVNGLYAAGDGAGLSRDIVNAAATGILAAEGILRKSGAL